MSKSKITYAFLDTNILLQFAEFTQIDWREITDSQSVCLVLTAINLSELDRFKYDPRSQRRQKRSRSVVSKIKDIMGGGASPEERPVRGRPGVTLRLWFGRTDMAKYPELDPEINDDRMLAAVQDFKANYPELSEDDVHLIANDIGVMFKAQQFGIKVTELAEKYLLPPEPDELNKRLKELETKVQHLSARAPAAEIWVEGADDEALHIEQRARNDELTSQLSSPPQEIRDLLERVKRAHANSPRQKRPSSTDLYGLSIPNISMYGRDLSVDRQVQSRIHQYLGTLGPECPPGWLRPVDVQTSVLSAGIEDYRPQPEGTDAHWYDCVMDLSDACYRDARMRFDSVASQFHSPLNFRVRNIGTDGMTGVSVEVRSELLQLSQLLPQFHAPANPRDNVPRFLAHLTSDEAPPSYQLSHQLETQFERLRPDEQAEISIGFFLTPNQPGEYELQITIRADNLAQPFTKSITVTFDAGTASEAMQMAESVQSIYGTAQT